MKRIFLSLVVVALAATAANSADFPGAKQPVQGYGVQQPAPYAKPGPATPYVKPAPVTKPAPYVKPAPMAKPAPYAKPAPAAPHVKPAPVAKPAPMAKPAPHAPGILPPGQRHPLHGNLASKIYHASDCEYYASKGATASFATARQAENAGFRACKVCEGREGVATAKRQHQQAAARRLHGNPSTKTLHGPSCKFYDARSSNARFTSFEQAARMGYKPCTLCGGK